jgi:CxxC-x17-CxxC domain-containing protein
MHNAICDKCKKECEVPFKPTGDKPVLCSDCFKKEGGNSRGSGGASAEQFKEINTKLDKIIGILQDLELDVEEDSDDEDSDDVENSDVEDSDDEDSDVENSEDEESDETLDNVEESKDDESDDVGPQ